MSGSFAAPQFGHVIASGEAHPPQKRRPALFSVPQLGQITPPIVADGLAAAFRERTGLTR